MTKKPELEAILHKKELELTQASMNITEASKKMFKLKRENIISDEITEKLHDMLNRLANLEVKISGNEVVLDTNRNFTQNTTLKSHRSPFNGLLITPITSYHGLSEEKNIYKAKEFACNILCVGNILVLSDEQLLSLGESHLQDRTAAWVL